MKRLFSLALLCAGMACAQLPTISNELFPQFRADLNTSLGLGVATTGSYANPSWITSFAWGKLTGVPTFEYQTLAHDGTAVTQRTKFNLAAGSNVTITASDNGTDTTTFTVAASGTGSGCAASGSAGVVQGSNGSGGCQASSITDNGTNVTTTEPINAPSINVGSGPAVTGSGIVGIKENTGQACVAAADCFIGDSVSHRVHVYNNGTTDGGAVVGASTTDTLTGKSIAASEINSGTLAAAQMPALTGDCTTSAGAVAVTCGSVITRTIASGTLALGTSAIASAACATVATATATGALATDSVTANPSGSIKAVTGYVPATSGVLTIYPPYLTSGQVNVDVCNLTAGSITPGAVTLNWRVTR